MNRLVFREADFALAAARSRVEPGVVAPTGCGEDRNLATMVAPRPAQHEAADVPWPTRVAVISGERARHLRAVLRVEVGAVLRAGARESGATPATVGAAHVEAVAADHVRLRYVPERLAPPLWPVRVVLAMPRPKVVTRTLEALAAFGVAEVILTNSWRVDKAYLQSTRLDDAAVAEALHLGAEQGGHARVPQVRLVPRFVALLEDLSNVAEGARLVAHPAGELLEAVGAQLDEGRITTLAFGPEGGWIDRELASFADFGFVPFRFGTAILRVETAVAVGLGQLAMVQRQDRAWR